MSANRQPLRQSCDVAGARALALRRAGYDARSSLELARRGDLELDRAVRLLGHGCPAHVARKILF